MPTQVAERPVATGDVLPVEQIRAHFPALARLHNDKPVAYFDGPGGTQVPRAVADAMTDYLLHHNANTHWNYPTSAETDAALNHAREVFADFFNASTREVVFGNNMTTLTFHVSRALGRGWKPGDEVVVTELDHQANVSPWRALEKERGVTVHSVPFDANTGELLLEELERAVTSRTKLVAIGAASNALGTITDVREAARLAHAKGALCYVDAVHFAAHRGIDVKAMECDFLVCSPYKFYGPHTGVLFAKADLMASLDVPKVAPATNEIPERVETGTQNHEGIVGAAAAVEFLASLAQGKTRRERLVNTMTALHERGEELFCQLWNGLCEVNGVQCFGPAPGRPRTPTVSFVVAGVPSAEVARRLVLEGIFASNGGFYASGVLDKFGLAKDGLVRAGCACYTTEEEMQRLIDGVRQVAKAR
jgi:cysteine desulfurase family protein (TIGR01976 family)